VVAGENIGRHPHPGNVAEVAIAGNVGPGNAYEDLFHIRENPSVTVKNERWGILRGLHGNRKYARIREQLRWL
jgi:hypothetical protein